MAVKNCLIRTDMRQHEIKNHGTLMFPCGGYTTTVGGAVMERIPWHWHEEIEVIVIVCGALKLEIPNHGMILKAGEAAFINSGVLHSAASADDGICDIHSFVFDPLLLFGFLESAIEQKYVRPLLGSPQLGAIHFERRALWHKEAIKCVEEAFARYREETFGYELLVRDYLSRLLFLIVSNRQEELARTKNAGSAETVRVKQMLGYIHAHYAEPVELKSIAASAAVSSRECLRCFNKVLGTTPMKYLLHYRISAAAGLLAGSDRSITEICRLSGFESPSYFSLKFKALMETTPREYRASTRI